MTKEDLAATLVAEFGFSHSRAMGVLNVLGSCWNAALTTFGEDAVIPGIGKITLHERAARTGRNPRTGEPVEIAASVRPKLRPSKALMRALNPEPEPRRMVGADRVVDPMPRAPELA